MTYHPSPPQEEGQGQGLAIASMVLGITAVPLVFCCFLGVVPAVVGVVLGHVALHQKTKSRGQAVSGVVLGYVTLGIAAVWGVLWVIGYVGSYVPA